MPSFTLLCPTPPPLNEMKILVHYQMHILHAYTTVYMHLAVARRCIPTFVNVQEQFEDVFNFNTSEGIQNTATTGNLGDLFLNLTVSDLVDGTL